MKKALCVILLFSLLVTLPACQKEPVDDLRVYVLDAGQSDCILLSQGDVHMLIDTGTLTQRDRILAQLFLLGVKELDTVLVTHPHEDHYGNVRGLIESLPVGQLLLPHVESDELGYRVLREIAAQHKIRTKTVSDGWKFSLGRASCSVLCALPADENINNTSLVLRVVFEQTVLLFMGDTEERGELALLERYGESYLDCDFLKIGHHGSDTASSERFLAAVSPRVAAISCGADNEYGFPHTATLARLAYSGARVYRTDTMDTLFFVCDEGEIIYEE